jgi:L-threonate 2-dehydrogenase
MSGKPTIAVIGLGAMGYGIAASLVRAGFAVRGCDVRAEVRERFARAGGTAAATPAEAARGAEIAIVVVVNAAQTDAVLFGDGGAASAIAPGGVVIASATVPPEYAESLGHRLAERGLLMIDAPTSGGPARSAEGQLTLMSSGAPAAYAKAEAALTAIATKVYRLGDAPGIGSKVKMINQLLAGVHIAAACEAMALGIRAGVDPNTLYEVISNSAGSSWMFQNRVPHILAGDYSPLSAVNIFVKDLGIVADSARALTFPVPLTALAHQLFLMAASQGHGGADDTSVIKVYQALAGLELPAKA